MNPTPNLRTQLFERPPTPPPAPSSRSEEVPGRARCFRATDHARGLLVSTSDTTSCFPYSHFLFAHLVASGGLVIRFATHRVLVGGENLEALLDELNAQRLELLRLLPKRLKDQAERGDVWIDRLEVTEFRAGTNVATQ